MIKGLGFRDKVQELSFSEFGLGKAVLPKPETLEECLCP